MRDLRLRPGLGIRDHLKHVKNIDPVRVGKATRTSLQDKEFLYDNAADQLSAEEIEEYKECFNLTDQSGDGKISKGELRPVLENLGMRPTDAEMDEVMATVDTDGSGYIDFNEFLAIVASVKPHSREDELREVFRTFDVDGNGYVDVSEVRSVNEAMGSKLSNDDIETLVSSADSNNDGKVTFEEFLKFMK